MSPRRQEIPPAEAGFALIEVLVSAVVIVVVSAGTFGLLQAMTRASGEQRHSSQAFAIAQEDQARLRSMQLIALSNLSEKREIKLAGTTFTVRSTGFFVNDKAAALSCDGENISADYAQVTSVVSWPGAASSERAVLRSIVSPTVNSIDSKSGTLTVQVTNEKKEPKAGVDLEAGIYSAETDANGCATFPDLPSGSVILKSNGEDMKLVTTNSVYFQETTAGVGAGAAKTAKLTYDNEGTISAGFVYRVGNKEEFKASSADSLTVVHLTMKDAKQFGSLGGPRLGKIDAKPFFPFTSPYSVYAGTCASSKPPEGTAAMPGATVSGGKTTPVTIQLPALNVTVWSGKNEANKGSPLPNAEVWVRDLECTKGGKPVTRVVTTNAQGNLDDPGFPWGSKYEVCADTIPGPTSTGSRKQTLSSAVSIKDLAKGTTVNFYLGSGSGAVSTTGICA